mmetsp:Transcript_110440/g.235923  ORF Transcript_110440/g.235923 Transcript_110440/m.235923 type:complete len:249 (-) Transcript_110440:908-1654(-)
MRRLCHQRANSALGAAPTRLAARGPPLPLAHLAIRRASGGATRHSYEHGWARHSERTGWQELGPRAFHPTVRSAWRSALLAARKERPVGNLAILDRYTGATAAAGLLLVGCLAHCQSIIGFRCQDNHAIPASLRILRCPRLKCCLLPQLRIAAYADVRKIAEVPAQRLARSALVPRRHLDLRQLLCSALLAGLEVPPLRLCCLVALLLELALHGPKLRSEAAATDGGRSDGSAVLARPMNAGPVQLAP